jgi:polysaccharide pyruvyl transferase WcaK-like protein
MPEELLFGTGIASIRGKSHRVADMNDRNDKICVFGASPGTGNQGVSALLASTLDGLATRGCSDLHVFGYGRETRPETFASVPCTLHGMSVGKRFWQASHLGRARLAAAIGRRGNPVVRTVADSDLVLDVSGGDSFTDLYGAARFRQIIAPKQIALATGRPLVLLPQTYGPFSRATSRRVARKFLAAARLAYARDEDSYVRLQELLGDRFDPARHRLGVDLAFGLKPKAPAKLDPSVAHALGDDSSERVGLNMSGLIANRPQDAAARFGLDCDYRALTLGLVSWFLENTDARLLLIPHVHAPRGHYESDLDAALTLLDGLPPRLASAAADRVTVVQQKLEAHELKWLIGQTDWFCGTRMHSTIAALSSGVPTAALAYSLKTRGVFATCQLADAVVDLRDSTVSAALDRLQHMWRDRRSTVETLAGRLPRVKALASRQLDEIVACAQGSPVAEHALPC